MPCVVKRESAKRDLIDHWVWYAENSNLETADRFLLAAEETAQMLSTQPESGIRVLLSKTELQGMRRFPISNGYEKIFLFYFPLVNGIDLVRVIHASRELERVVEEGFLR
jgi:toxin ParE1/3/4